MSRDMYLVVTHDTRDTRHRHQRLGAGICWHLMTMQCDDAIKSPVMRSSNCTSPVSRRSINTAPRPAWLAGLLSSSLSGDGLGRGLEGSGALALPGIGPGMVHRGRGAVTRGTGSDGGEEASE